MSRRIRPVPVFVYVLPGGCRSQAGSGSKLSVIRSALQQKPTMMRMKAAYWGGDSGVGARRRQRPRLLRGIETAN